jgi:hypothetical protein|nr:MAG TPA: hypothetical protein [Caudoviricetes sp.]
MARTTGLGFGRKLAKGLAVAGAAIWGFGLGLWAFGPEEGAGAVPTDYPGVSVEELRAMPKAAVKIDGRTFRQDIGIQVGGKYSQSELEQAKADIAKGCSVYEDLSVDCTAGSYVNAVGETLKEYEARVIAPQYGEGETAPEVQA